MFPREKQSTIEARYITVTRAGVVLYRGNTIVVEQEGKPPFKFNDVKVLQVYNRIEGYLTFFGSSSPPGRIFPGYGELFQKLNIVQTEFSL